MLSKNKLGKSSHPRLLIAKLREGDYAHAGGEEAIEIVLNGIKELVTKNFCKKDTHKKKLKAIDIGCGLGGTANYIANTTDFIVYGVDIDKYSIQHARNKYRNVEFFNCNVLDVKREVSVEKFDVAYMFNSFYAFENQLEALKVLSDITNQNGLLVIFDYLIESEVKSSNLVDLAGKTMRPICASSFESNLQGAGWKLVKIVNLHEKFENWYSEVVSKLHENRMNLLNEFTEETYMNVENTFLKIVNNIRNKSLSGAIIYASKIS